MLSVSPSDLVGLEAAALHLLLGEQLLLRHGGSCSAEGGGRGGEGRRGEEVRR